MPIMAPLARPLGKPGLQGKLGWGPEFALFGGSNGLDCLSKRKKYCHNGGMAFAPPSGVGLPGGPRWR